MVTVVYNERLLAIEINGFNEYLAKTYEQAYTPKWKEIKKSQLKRLNGLLQVDEKKNEIDESLMHIVQQDKDIQKIVAKLNELRDSGELTELKENEIEQQDDKETEQ